MLAVDSALQVVSSLLRGIKKGMLTVKLWDNIFLHVFRPSVSVIPRGRQSVPDEILAGLSGSGTSDGPLFCVSALTVYFRQD